MQITNKFLNISRIFELIIVGVLFGLICGILFRFIYLIHGIFWDIPIYWRTITEEENGRIGGRIQYILHCHQEICCPGEWLAFLFASALFMFSCLLIRNQTPRQILVMLVVIAFLFTGFVNVELVSHSFSEFANYSSETYDLRLIYIWIAIIACNALSFFAVVLFMASKDFTAPIISPNPTHRDIVTGKLSQPQTSSSKLPIQL